WRGWQRRAGGNCKFHGKNPQSPRMAFRGTECRQRTQVANKDSASAKREAGRRSLIQTSASNRLGVSRLKQQPWTRLAFRARFFLASAAPFSGRFVPANVLRRLWELLLHDGFPPAAFPTITQNTTPQGKRR